MSTAEPVLQTFQLRREYGDTVAVRDIDLAVPRQAVVALVGPNGAGKTTLLKMLAALLEPTRGTARVCGLDIRESPREVHSRIGFLPDFYGLYDDLVVEDYLEYFARAYRIPRARRAEVVAGALDLVELHDQRTRPLDALSRGMRQRLAIARTLLHDPPVLLLDEPASGLDPEARHELQFLFRRLAESGKTLIVSSHILTELEDYCTHIAIMQKGALVASGEAARVRDALTQGRQLRVRAADDRGLEALLKKDPRVRQLARGESGWTFLFSGGEPETAGLLRQLVEAGVPVVFFGEEKRTIQDTYLALMRRGP